MKKNYTQRCIAAICICIFLIGFSSCSLFNIEKARDLTHHYSVDYKIASNETIALVSVDDNANGNYNVLLQSGESITVNGTEGTYVYAYPDAATYELLGIPSTVSFKFTDASGDVYVNDIHESEIDTIALPDLPAELHYANPYTITWIGNPLAVGETAHVYVYSDSYNLLSFDITTVGAQSFTIPQYFLGENQYEDLTVNISRLKTRHLSSSGAPGDVTISYTATKYTSVD